MNISVQDFVQEFKNKKIMNNKINDHAITDYIREKLEIKTYIPFNEKRKIAEMVVAYNTEEINGVKKNDAINQYLSFIVAMIKAHTSLEFSSNSVADYDLLAESGLLPKLVAEFQESYTECDVILKMALAMELEDNNINVLVGHFLDNILKKLDDVGSVLKGKLDSLDLKDMLGDFKQEDLAKLSGFLDKLK